MKKMLDLNEGKMKLDLYEEFTKMASYREDVLKYDICTLEIKITHKDELIEFTDFISKFNFVINYEIKYDILTKEDVWYHSDIIAIDIETEEYFDNYDLFEIIIL